MPVKDWLAAFTCPFMLVGSPTAFFEPGTSSSPIVFACRCAVNVVMPAFDGFLGHKSLDTDDELTEENSPGELFDDSISGPVGGRMAGE